MPIVRTYQCPDCFARTTVTLSAEEWDAPAPFCEACDTRLNQEFKAPAIGGSVAMRAAKITEDIMRNDYGVSNWQGGNREGDVGKVTYKDQTSVSMPSQWQKAGHQAILEQAISIGKAHRGRDGLDILQRNLRDGTQVDLIEASKRRAIKVY